MVYCGGLENRFGGDADGGSNPSLSATPNIMSDTIWIIIAVAVVGGVFAWLWRGGYLNRFAAYVAQTKEELRKCTWPTWDELKGSTMLISVAIVLLGAFTVAVDFVFSLLVRYIT